MKSTQIVAVVVHRCDTGMGRTFVFVRVRVADGRTGTGEASQNDLDAGVIAAVEQIADWLHGRDVFHSIEPLVQRLMNDRLGRQVWAAVGAVEQALWDLMGQFSDRPVHELLGGSAVPDLECYATISAGVTNHDPDGLAEEARRCVDRGFHGVKVVPDVERRWGKGGDDLVLARIRAVRDAIGPGPMLMVECAFSLDLQRAIRLAQAVSSLGITWLEAPLSWDDVELLERLGARTDIPIASGELIFGRRSARLLLERQAVPILQPDVKWAGGILEVKKIAAWAETYQISIAPHNNSGAVASLASAHVALTLPNLVALELPSRVPTWQSDLSRMDWDGSAPIQRTALQRPGLGVDFNDDLARKLAA